MPVIATTLHDPVALAATCRRLGLPAPVQGSVLHDSQEVYGWVVRLPGLTCPVVCDTLTGQVAYHPRDGAPACYGRIQRFLRHYLDLKAGMPGGCGRTFLRPDPTPRTVREAV